MEITAVEKTLADNGYIVHSIHGVSMLPLLRQDMDAVHLVPIRGILTRDDIALFKRTDGALVLHRVVKVLPDAYIIRGDNCLRNEYVAATQVIGVAQGVYRDGQYCPCTEPTIRRYATRQRISLPLRRLRHFLGRIKRKLFGKEK